MNSADRLENIATMTISAALVLGLYWLGAGGHSFWGLVLLLNTNIPKSKVPERRM